MLGDQPIFGRSISILCKFIDDSSKFTWIYLLQIRFDVFQVFLNFQQFVERALIKKKYHYENDWDDDIKNLILSFKRLALLIMSLVLMPMNKVFLPTTSTVKLFRLVSRS
jgi:hypothetical protein